MDENAPGFAAQRVPGFLDAADQDREVEPFRDSCCVLSEGEFLLVGEGSPGGADVTVASRIGAVGQRRQRWGSHRYREDCGRGLRVELAHHRLDVLNGGRAYRRPPG